jgi:putative SOS response-associated peptidase YedK
MIFSRKAAAPQKVLRLIRSQDWRQGETLRVTQKPRWDITPGARRLVIRRQDIGELALSPMRWGLSVDRSFGDLYTRPLNTIQAETIGEHREWRRLLNGQRCLLPADQFFEWKRVDGIKTREFSFRLKSGRPMMIAGLWNRSPQTGDSFAYITCPANRLVSLVHDRMPVILSEQAIADWFNPDAAIETLLGLMQPVGHGELEVSSVQQRPAERPAQPSLFDRRAA